ncbi:MAG: DEAD/DEAH box helicase [bacterium]|nr:DEAD/DEAH box helicase [bacterium]
MPSKEGFNYKPRPKTEDQLRSQVETVSRRVGHSIIPVSLGEQAYTTEEQEIQKRFPNHYGIYINELKAAHAERHDVFVADSRNPRRDQLIANWQQFSGLVTNLNRYIAVHQQRGEQEVRLKERQMNIFEEIRDRIEDGETEGTVQAPTGFGKTVIFNQLVSAANVSTLIVVPTRKLVEQTYDRFRKFTPEITTGRVYSKRKEFGRQITITTYSSLIYDNGEKLINPEGIGLVILDESHRGTSEKRVQKIEAVEQFKDAVILGLSATPVEIQDKRLADTRVARMTKNLWHSVSEREAIEEGYLCTLSSVLVEVNVDLTDIQITAKGDYDEKQLETRINTVTQNKAAVEFFLKVKEQDLARQKTQGRKKLLPLITSLYASSVAHAKELALELQAAGVRAAAVWGTSDKREQTEQDEIMKKWEHGEIEVVCSKDLLVEGLDIPSIRFVMNVAPTASEIVEKQRSGRGLRLDKNNPSKETIIADFVYKNSDKRHQQVTYPKVVGAARITKFVDNGPKPSGPGGGAPIDLEDIQIDGLRIVTNTEEVMRISTKEARSVSAFGIKDEYKIPTTTFWKIIQRLKKQHNSYFKRSEGPGHTLYLSEEEEQLLRRAIETRKQAKLENDGNKFTKISANQIGKVHGVSAKTVLNYLEKVSQKLPGSVKRIPIEGDMSAYYTTLEANTLLDEMLTNRDPLALGLPTKGYIVLSPKALRMKYGMKEITCYKAIKKIMVSHPEFFIARGRTLAPFISEKGMQFVERVLSSRPLKSSKSY